MCQIHDIISDACTICDGRGRIGGKGLAVAVLHFVTIFLIIVLAKMPNEIIQGTTNYPYWSLCPVGRIQISRYAISLLV